MEEDVLALIDELEDFQVNVNSYYSDGDYTSFVDSLLVGKLRSLKLYCQKMQLYHLITAIDELNSEPGTAIETLETLRGYILKDVRRCCKAEERINDEFWQFIHPKVISMTKTKFDNSFYADAVESALKEVNKQVKVFHRNARGQELDGANLMNTALSPNNPVIRFSPMQSNSDKDLQTGYMQIFAGTMTGIRNPKAHDNLTPSRHRTIHLLFLASLLMYKLDEAGVLQANSTIPPSATP